MLMRRRQSSWRHNWAQQWLSVPEEIWASDVDAVLIASSTNTHADLLSGAILSWEAHLLRKTH